MKLLNFDGNMETLHFPFEERQGGTNEVWIVSFLEGEEIRGGVKYTKVDLGLT